MPAAPFITSPAHNSTSISLTWTQPPDDVVDWYTVSSTFSIPACEGIAEATGAANRAINGTLRMYTLSDLKANTDHTISISAVNGAGNSEMSNTELITTDVAGVSHFSLCSQSI